MDKIKLFFWTYPCVFILYTILLISTGSTYEDFSFSTNGFKKLPINSYLNLDKTPEISQFDFYDLIERNYNKEIKINRLGIFEKKDETILYIWTSLSSSDDFNSDNWWVTQKPCYKVIVETSKRVLEFQLIGKILVTYEKDLGPNWKIADNLIYFQNNEFKLNHLEVNIPIVNFLYSYLIVLGLFAILHIAIWLHSKYSLKIVNEE